ncbi:uncharacterized protein [Primulina eburnea]|uniref:uncharacterized protein n=1 Tax=Primulina eburnea TaxID=1245227 RepID=UPI003C6C3E2D
MSKRSITDYFIQKNNEQLSKTPNDHLPSSSRSTLKTKKLKPDNEVALDPLEGNNPYYERDPGKRIGYGNIHKKFTVEGFKNWKRVNCKTCPLKRHEGDCNSLHSTAMQKWEGLKNVSQHIDRRMNKQSENIVKQNRLFIRTSIRAVRWLALQGCAFRGHDESVDSHNRGNFLDLVKFQGELCKEIDDIILDKASKNANKIRDEVGDAKFCILVDEAIDESRRSQMAIVLRYVDCDGFVRERFFEVIGVDDTNSLTLKTHICSILTQHKLLIENMRGQGYDGARNMRGEWNGLQKNHFTVEEYYHFHVFNVVIDKQLMELNTRFTEKSIELFTLCEALNLCDGFKSFSESAIYSLIDKFYPNDFSKDDMKHLKTQLDHYKLDVFEDPRFKDVDSLPKLCRLLVETENTRIYFIIDRLIRLVLTLPVSTATTERAFSGMKLLKTPLRNKMEHEYLNNAMVLYIEREIAHDIDTDYIIDRFDLLKNRRLQLK